MLLCQLSPVVQPGIGHCSTRKVEAARLGLLEQRHEVLLEVEEVLVHAVLLVAAHEAAHGVHAERNRRIERRGA